MNTEIKQRQFNDLHALHVRLIRRDNGDRFVTVTEGAVTYINPKAAAEDGVAEGVGVRGVSAEEVAGNTPNILNSGQQDKAFYSNMWRSLMNRGEWHGEIRNRRKDGEAYTAELSISAVRDARGQLSHYVGVFSDITGRKQAEESNELLAGEMSHRVKNLLAIATGLTDRKSVV